MRNLRIPGSILLMGATLVSALYEVTGTPTDVPNGLTMLVLTIVGSFMLVYGGDDE
jgi:hypothetical protein